jgi:HSP20 family protein
MPTKKTESAPTLARRTPPAVRDFDQVFESLWNRAHTAFGLLPFEPTFLGLWSPTASVFRAAPTDVVDTGKAFQIKAEVPGLAKDQIEIRVKGTFVEISGESKTEKTDKADDSSGYLQRERVYTSFHRAFELPDPVVGEKAKAQVVNGVLELELPKVTPSPEPAETKVKVE